MIDARLTAQVDLETEKSRKKVIELQNEIRKLEEAIIATREQKLTDGKDAKSIAEFNKELQKSSIELKKKRLALRDANAELKQKIAANREATKAQQQFTQAVTTSKDGVEAINSVLAKYPSSTQATAQSLEALKNRLIELRRLRFNEILNPADQKLLARQIFETTNEIRDQKTALAQLAREAKASEQANKRLSASQQQFRNQAGASNNVALEFNRIIQDAPFGIIGVGNNIQQLATNFSSLRASAGGTGAAISAALTSILSPVNLALLGISALTTGFTAYKLGLFDNILGTRDLKEETEKYAESLTDLRKVQLDGLKNADAEILKLNALRSIIESETSSREQKNKAIEVLQNEYPSYFGNMTKEQILAGGLQKTYEALTKTLIARATAESSIAKIVEIQEEERLLLEKTRDVRAQIAGFEAKALNARVQGQEELAIINENQIRFLKNQNPELARLEEIDDSRKELTSLINKNLAEANVLLDDGKRKADDLGKSFKAIDEDILFADIFEGIDKKFASVAGNLQSSLKNELNLVEAKLSKALEVGDTDGIKILQERITKIKSLLTAFGTEIKEIPIDLAGLESAEKVELGIIEKIRAKIDEITKLRDATTDPTRIASYNEQLKQLQSELSILTNTKIVDDAKVLADSLSGVFSAMVQQITASLNISNDSLKAFVGTLLSNAPKIIKAIQASAKARETAAKMNISSAGKEAAGEGISLAAKAANALGPVGMALLPVFISGAMALISGAFRKIGGNTPSSAGGSAVRSAGANTTGSSITGVGQAFDMFGDLQLSTFIRGTNIELVLERVNQQRRA